MERPTAKPSAFLIPPIAHRIGSAPSRPRPRTLSLSWQTECERRTAADLTDDGDVAAHRAGQVAADRQTEPRSFGARHTRPQLHEWLEDQLELARRNAGARVTHANVDTAVTCLPIDADLPFGRRELHRVREQIEKHLSHSIAIGAA